MKTRTMISTALALVLSAGAGIAFAHGGHFYQKGYSDHGVYKEHNRHWGASQRHTGYYEQQGAYQGVAPGFEQHGGGHEQAANNAEYHRGEMQDPNHRD